VTAVFLKVTLEFSSRVKFEDRSILELDFAAIQHLGRAVHGCTSSVPCDDNRERNDYGCDEQPNCIQAKLEYETQGSPVSPRQPLDV